MTLERFAPCMQQKVLCQRAPFEKTFPTNLTAERPLAFMTSQMCSKAAPGNEALRAVLAGESSRGVMSHKVIVKIFYRLPTQVTHLPSTSSMVVVQPVSIFKLDTTSWAQQGVQIWPLRPLHFHSDWILCGAGIQCSHPSILSIPCQTGATPSDVCLAHFQTFCAVLISVPLGV